MNVGHVVVHGENIFEVGFAPVVSTAIYLTLDNEAASLQTDRCVRGKTHPKAVLVCRAKRAWRARAGREGLRSQCH